MVKINATTGYIVRMSSVGMLLALIAYVMQLSPISWIWSAITVYMVMDIRHGLTLKGGMNRLISAMIGTTLGYVCAVVFFGANWFSLALGMSVIGFVGGHLSFSYPGLKVLCMNACVVFIMSKMPTIEMPIWKIAFERTANNALGIALVFITSLGLLTHYSMAAAQKKLLELQNCNATYVQTLFNRMKGAQAQSPDDYLLHYQRLSIQLKTMLMEAQYEKKQGFGQNFVLLQHWLQQQDELMIVLGTIAWNASDDNSVLMLFFDNFTALKNALQNYMALGEDLWLSVDNAVLAAAIQRYQAEWLKFQHQVDAVREQKIFSSYSIEAIKRFYKMYSLLATLAQSIKPLHTSI